MLCAVLLTQWLGAFRCAGGCGPAGLRQSPHVHIDAVLPIKSAKSSCGCRGRQPDAEGRDRAASWTDRFQEPATPAGCDGVLRLLSDVGSGRSVAPTVLPNDTSDNDTPFAEFHFVAARPAMPTARHVSPPRRATGRCPVYYLHCSLLI